MRVLCWIVCCVFEGFLEVVVGHGDHGDTLLVYGYPFGTGTRVPEYPGIRPEKTAGFVSDPDPVMGRTLPGKPAGYPGPTRTGGIPTMDISSHTRRLGTASFFAYDGRAARNNESNDVLSGTVDMVCPETICY